MWESLGGGKENGVIDDQWRWKAWATGPATGSGWSGRGSEVETRDESSHQSFEPAAVAVDGAGDRRGNPEIECSKESVMTWTLGFHTMSVLQFRVVAISDVVVVAVAAAVAVAEGILG